MSDVNEIVERLVTMLAPSKVETVRPEDRLIADLAFHSLALVELAFTLEDVFDLDEDLVEEATGIERVSDVTQFVERYVNDGSARLPSEETLADVAEQYGFVR